MKTIFAALFTMSVLAAGAADAAPHHRAHKVCTVRHHHRVCRWVR